MLPRPLYTQIFNDLILEKSMIFMAGPRQVGKTTLAQSLADSYSNKVYLNWDIISSRARFIENPTFFEDIERTRKQILGVGGHDTGPDPRAVFGHRGGDHRIGEYTFLEKVLPKRETRHHLTHDHRDDRAVAGSRVEAERLNPLL